jgi:release factor glutamine methyltransferase
VVARLRAAGCVWAEEEAALLAGAARSPEHLDELVAARVRGVPLEQLVGWAEFRGLRVGVVPGVFVPRRRTALLVELAGDLLAVPLPLVVDLCCGTGAVGLAVVAEHPDVELHAADVDPVATTCAAANLGDRGEVHTGDLYDALPRGLAGRVDLLLCNAPYVPSDAVATMPPEARDHEPRTALDGGEDGVDLHRRVAAGAPEWLAPGGSLVVETSRAQAALTLAACESAGLAARVVTDDDLDATAVVATRSVDSASYA